MNTAEQLAGLILDADLPKRQAAEIERLQDADRLREAAFQCYVEEQQKNRSEIARLRAAAQELLVALQLALPHIDNAGSPGGCDGSHDGCDHCAAISAVRAAIAIHGARR